MKLKYKVKQNSKLQWVVWKNKTVYWTETYESEQAAIEASLYREGTELVDKMDEIQKRMESVPGMINLRDPYAWRA